MTLIEATTPTLNIPLLRKLVEWAETQEKLGELSHWKQSWWARILPSATDDDMVEGVDYCGTSFCAAGFVSYIEGWRPVLNSEGYADDARRGGEKRAIRDIATDALGIDVDDASRLFHGGISTAAELRDIAEDIAGERL